MPKATSFKSMSKREQRAFQNSLPLPPKPQRERVVRVAREKAQPEPADRDGLVWLAKKGKLTKAQARAGFHYRDLVRAAPAGGLKVVDLCGAGGGGGMGGGLPLGGSFGDQQAALELFVIRNFTLGKEPDMILVMDGVCGMCHTVRYLAGNDQLRSHELLAALRIALNLLIEATSAKEAAKRAA